MFDWIWDNKEWLFSGVGGILLVLVFSWLKNRIKSRKTQEPSLNGATLQDIIDAPPPPKQERDILATSLSPAKIMKEVESAPLLQQPDVRKQYEGIKASWKGKLSYAEKINEKSIRLMILVTEKSSHTSIFFNVNPKQYPGIRLLREGHEILVEGRIEEVSSYIDLKAEKLIFNIDNSV